MPASPIALAAALLLAAAAPSGGASEVPGAAFACPPVVCEALGRAGPPLTLPDPARLAAADSVTEALLAVTPGLERPRLGPAGSLDEELTRWAHRLGHPAPGDLPALTPPVRRALAELLAGARHADGLRASAVPADPSFARDARRAFSLYDPSGIPGREAPAGLADLGARIDFPRLAQAAAAMALAGDRAVALAGDTGVAGPCDGEPQPPTEIQGGIAVDTAGVRTRYQKPYLLTLDLGGCDVYEGEIASADGSDRPAGITVDLGSEADTYTAPAETYAQGTASEGVALLIDAGGNDTYTSFGYAAQGAGIVGGAGILADLAGNDTYDLIGFKGGFGAQGNGTLGFGGLLDLGGDDEYTYDFDPGETSFGTRLLGAQGAGIVGQAALADAGGNDRYLSRTVGNIVSLESQGAGDFLQGSYGFLVDASGGDSYTVQADVSSPDKGASGAARGQGLGIFDAVGLLLDAAGADTYRLDARGVGAEWAAVGAMGQGAASGSLRDPAWGGLIDLGGDDSYRATARAQADDPTLTAADSLAQGFGILEGVGTLVDLSGDDPHVQTASARYPLASGQGAGLAAGLGVLIDRTGNDIYLSGDLSQGYGGGWTFGELYVPGGNGVLVDGSGRDTFSGPGQGSTFWTHGRDGVGVGLAGGSAPGIVYDLVDAFFGGFRPHFVDVAITSPQPGVLHGDFTLTGTASAGLLEPDAAEWRTAAAPWSVAAKGQDWRTWSAEVDAETLADGVHKLQARAWSNNLDSAVAEVEIEMERWLPAWDVQAEGNDLRIAFDLATRAGDPAVSSEVALEVRSASGEVLATREGISAGGGRYETAWTPPGPGTYTLRAVLPGQVLGETSVTL